MSAFIVSNVNVINLKTEWCVKRKYSIVYKEDSKYIETN